MKSFKISTYNISSIRLTGKQKVTCAILADLHGLVFGKNHQTLYKAIIATAKIPPLNTAQVIIPQIAAAIR